MKKTKYIPYDYLVGSADAFPYIHRMVYLKILESAPFMEADKDRDEYMRGYEAGLLDGKDLYSEHSIDETERTKGYDA